MSEAQQISDIGKRREEAQWRAGLDRIDAERGRSPVFQAGESDLHLRVKRAAVEDLRECRWSREQVAEGLTRLVGREVSIAQLDAMLAESKTHRLPVEWVPAWVRVTGSRRLLELLVAECGMWLADEVEHDLAEIGRLKIEAEKASAREAELRSRVWQRI